MGTTPVLFTPVLTTREVAEVLGIHRATLVAWVEAGHAHPSRKMPGPNGSYVFDADEVDRLRTAPRPKRGRPAA